MKGKLALFVAALSAIGALALAPAVFGASTVTTVKCSGKFTSLTPRKLKGADVGLVSCGKPFGKGIEWVNYSETVTANGTVSTHGTVKAWSDLGTLRGTYKLVGKLSGMSGTASGKSKITGGTGAFSGARGTGTEKCSTNDAGATLSCTFKLRLTKL